MLNDIISGISAKLNETFGDGYEIYIEEVKQGLTEPCFSVSCVNPTNTQALGTRSLRRNLFSIQYFPKSTTKAKAEGLDVQDRLFLALEYITVTGDLMRGTNMSGRLVDGVLVFMVNYDLYIRQELDLDPMETLTVTNSTKE